ncbi:MAG TPA: hypothetical protein VI357_09000 [Mycobacteriales bacterium]
MSIDPGSLIDRLGGDIGAVLGDRLLGLYVHGSDVTRFATEAQRRPRSQ